MSEIIFITGANRGIGLALTIEGLARGYTVIGTARTAAKTEAMVASHRDAGERFRAVTLDVATDESVAAALADGDFPVVDVLINNAAVFPEEGEETLEELNLSHLSEAFETNVVGVVRVTRALLPRLARAARPRIINVSSTAGCITRKNSHSYYAYATSKAALNMITRAMAAELKPRGMIMVALTPGWVKTEMGGERAPLTAAETARSIVGMLDGMRPEQAGTFIERDGEPSPAAW